MTLSHFWPTKEQVKQLEVPAYDAEVAADLYEQNEGYLAKLSTSSFHHARQQLSRLRVKTSVLTWFVAWFQTFMLAVLSYGPTPQHLSFIMDGNRRYAKRLGQPVKEGHKAGGAKLIDILYICKRLNVNSVSAYAFSIENFNRSPAEVDTLMGLLGYYIDQFTQRATDARDDLYGIKLKIAGDMSYLSGDLVAKIRKAEELTRNGTQFTLYLALPYTSRNDIAHAMKVSVENCVNSNADITEEALTQNMYFEKHSDKCDLLIRTSGHTRLSDYMLWQVHENGILEFSDCLWPDYGFWRLYFTMLKWSFYNTWQQASLNWDNEQQQKEYNDNNNNNASGGGKDHKKHNNNSSWFPALSDLMPGPVSAFRKTKGISLESLPPAPLAVTVVDRK